MNTYYSDYNIFIRTKMVKYWKLWVASDIICEEIEAIDNDMLLSLWRLIFFFNKK